MEGKIEEQVLEVFGTKSVSVKEFMGGTDKSLMLLSNYSLAKQNLEGLKAKHEARVEELVLVEKLSTAELKELNSIRGELREPRYLVQKIEKNNISVFETYKKTDKANLKTLIDILKSTEDKADEKIKVEEDRKKNEKAEEARLEQLRIDTIKAKIDTFETSSYQIIQSTKFNDIGLSKTMLDALVNHEFDYEEYDILFEQARDRVQKLWDDKCSDLREKENQRLDNIRLEEEAKEQKRISDLQASRLNELLPFNAYGADVDMATLWSLEESVYSGVLSSKKALFEADAKNKKDEEEAASAKLKEEKETILVIKRNRLNEIGFDFAAFQGFNHRVFPSVKVDSEQVYNSDVVEFEKIFFDAKIAISNAEKEAKELEEKEEAKEKETESRIAKLIEAGLQHSDEHGTYFVAADSGWMVLTEQVSIASPEQFDEMLYEAKQAISDYKQSKEDADTLKKENKARVKRLASDKKVLGEFIDSLDFHSPVPELENDDLQEALDGMLEVLKEMKEDLQTVLKNF